MSNQLADTLFEALWKKVVDDWENDAAHGTFLQHCQDNGQLAEAAARYRGMSGDSERGPSAEKRLQAVAMLAIANLESQRSSTARRPPVGAVVMAVFFVLSAGLLLYLFID